MNESLFEEFRRHFWETRRGILPPADSAFERLFQDTIALEAGQNFLGLVVQNAGLDGYGRVLDMGCGFGTFVLACRMNGYRAFGIDISPYELDFARRRMADEGPDNVSQVYSAASAESLPFADGSFQVVTLWNILEHVPDYKEVLHEADRVLSPGGFIFLLAPNYLTIRQEAHYHVPWFSLMPRGLAKVYLKLIGRDPSFFMSSIFYVTNLGVLSHLKSMGYELIFSELRKLEDPNRCRSALKTKVLRAIKAFGGDFLIRMMVQAMYFNPFRSAISVCAKKAG